ncbi:MAG: hypothetical protein AB7S75_08620 [Desulfococcaceae bacterium]
MPTLHKNYILDENHIPCAVIIPIAEFEHIEKILEKHSLTKMQKEPGNRRNVPDMWIEECFELMDKANGNSQWQKSTWEELYDFYTRKFPFA